jgi:hypothetical protein
LAREERDRGKRVKIAYRKIQRNGEWFRWDERDRGETEEKFLEEREKRKTTRRENVQGEGE